MTIVPEVIKWSASKVGNSYVTIGRLYCVVFLTIDGDYGWYVERIHDRVKGRRLLPSDIASKGRADTKQLALEQAEEALAILGKRPA